MCYVFVISPPFQAQNHPQFNMVIINQARLWATFGIVIASIPPLDGVNLAQFGPHPPLHSVSFAQFYPIPLLDNINLAQLGQFHPRVEPHVSADH